MKKTFAIPAVITYCCLTTTIFAAGVPIGSSSLIDTLDYSDDFTVGTFARPDGLYNNNTNGGYNVQSTYGNPAATWMPFADFSFNSGGISTCCGYPSNTGNAGAVSGLAQTGGNQFNFAYGLHSNYIVQVDSVLPGDRLDIASVSAVGSDQIADPNALAVFFRRNASGNIGIYRAGVGETAVGLSGITDNDWHNYAVNFDHYASRLGIYVDETLLYNVDLLTFAGGVYSASYSNAAVGLGGTFVHWDDNFQIGAVPEPSTAMLAVFGFLGLFAARRRMG